MHCKDVILLLLFLIFMFGLARTQETVKLDIETSLVAMKFIGEWLVGHRKLVSVILPDMFSVYQGL